MDEFGRIARYFAPLAGPEGLGLRDDAALLQPPAGQVLVLSKDVAVEGIHFPKDCAPDLAARRALRPNLSDMAAMGAEPLGYLLGLSLPDRYSENWIEGFAAALAADQQTFGLSLWGGDSTRAPQDVSISITIIGAAPIGTPLKRSGAKPGDDIYVSGMIGAAAAGLDMVLKDKPGQAAWREAYCAPEPRLALGQGLRGLATAAIDISDGLIADIGHIATASGCAARLALADIPLPEGLPLPPDVAITAGDDYELAFTAPPSRAEAIFTLSETLGLSLTRIGVMQAHSDAAAPVTVTNVDGQELTLEKTGWRHTD